MPTALRQPAEITNQILAGLPREKYSRLFSNLRLVRLPAHRVLYEIEDTIRCNYFMNNGMASLLSMSADGDSIEVGNIGNEGLVGIHVVLRQPKTPYQVVVQISGDAMVVSADILRHEFEEDGELKDRLLWYTHALSTYMSQLGVCSHFHTVDKRLCRWLLITSDRVQSRSFQLTHEFLSQVLGTGRTGVTMAATRLQRLGLIQYHRGEISILNRAAMEAVTCDCYEITKKIFEHSPGFNSSES